MNETQLRERLSDLAEAAPIGRAAPAELLRRARRRVVLTVATSVVAAVLVLAAGVAGVRALQTSKGQPGERDLGVVLARWDEGRVRVERLEPRTPRRRRRRRGATPARRALRTSQVRGPLGREVR